jgi:cell division protein FtsL
MSAHFGMYREQAAEKFVTWEAIHQIEKRILEQQDKSEERLAKSLGDLAKQFERIIDIRLKTQGP